MIIQPTAKNLKAGLLKKEASNAFICHLNHYRKKFCLRLKIEEVEHIILIELRHLTNR